jgi:YVTN family beta-propeller protein
MLPLETMTLKFRSLYLAVLVLTFAACQAGVSQVRSRLDDEGGLYVYLQPLPREADRLRVVVEGISAIHEDGRYIPLSISLRELNRKDAARQRLIATGFLPAGGYSGLIFRTRSASLTGEAGDAALLVPDAAARIDVRFVVRRREGHVIALALQYEQAVEAGFRFAPAFAVYVPERPAPGRMGFVSNGGSDDVTVFDKHTRQVFAVIATGRGPRATVLDQRARTLYVALSAEDGIEVIDVSAGRVTDRIRLTPGDEPVGLAITPDARTLVSVNRGSNTVSMIDPTSRFELARIRVGNGPRSILIDRTGRRAFVFDTNSNTVSVLDIPSRNLVRTIPTEPGPVRGDLNRRGDRLYVVHEIAPYVTVINVATLTVARRFPVRAPMDAIKVDPSTDLVYLASGRDRTVDLYDPLSFNPVDFVQAGTTVRHIVADSDENALYLASPQGDRVLVVDRIRKRLIAEIDVGADPSWISVAGEQ